MPTSEPTQHPQAAPDADATSAPLSPLSASPSTSSINAPAVPGGLTTQHGAASPSSNGLPSGTPTEATETPSTSTLSSTTTPDAAIPSGDLAATVDIVTARLADVEDDQAFALLAVAASTLALAMEQARLTETLTSILSTDAVPRNTAPSSSDRRRTRGQTQNTRELHHRNLTNEVMALLDDPGIGTEFRDWCRTEFPGKAPAGLSDSQLRRALRNAERFRNTTPPASSEHYSSGTDAIHVTTQITTTNDAPTTDVGLAPHPYNPDVANGPCTDCGNNDPLAGNHVDPDWDTTEGTTP